MAAALFVVLLIGFGETIWAGDGQRGMKRGLKW